MDFLAIGSAITITRTVFPPQQLGLCAFGVGQIARFKGGRTRLAYETEHAVDPSISVESGPAFSVQLGPIPWVECRLDGAVVR